ncbi:MFS transporter [Microbacterium hominis]|uniref:MFS transporter n=1 Tax=Microbacterium TaxID=33882 RepID=UPI00168B9823|nr:MULTISPECIES: MFS transporter [Microbacterium]QOC24968.1 MFS transporter [Microbacterium hominis]QOC29016.1 MFS transporter [Microbacterium hominis]QRY40552.1 MFS transporter [Microbacterium hominis]QYF98773.1 MFS transporter [Microbacterium sp. PAMC21962]
MTSTLPTSVVRSPSVLAVPLLGVLAAVQGSAPNIAATALVGASRGLDMVGGDQALAASMQTLAIAASVITTGLLADRIGRRRMLVAALVTGLVGQLIVAAAPMPAVYILGQAVSGVGLGAVYAAAFAYIQVLAAPGRLPAAVATFAACSGAAGVVFTFSGGMLAGADWRLAFLLVPLLSALSIPAVLALLPAVAPSVTEKRDVWGQIALITGMVVLLFGVSQLASSLRSPLTWAAIALGALLLGAFVWSQTRVAHPFFPVALFRRPLFLAALCAGFVFNAGGAVAFLQLSNLWQYVLGLTPGTVAVWQLPVSVTSILGAIVLGRLMTRGMSPQTSLLVGGVLSAAGFGAAFLARDAASPLAFVPAGILIALGITAAALPYGTLVLSEAPAEFYGPVTSSRTTFGQLFYSLGTALSTVVVTQLTVAGITSRLSSSGMSDAAVQTALTSVGAYAKDGTRPDAAVFDAALGAYRDGFGALMLGMAVVALVVSVVGAALIARAHRGLTSAR